MLKEFKAFAMRGNVVDLAVGVIIGAAFGKIVTSMTNDVIMPVVGLVLGSIIGVPLGLVMTAAMILNLMVAAVVGVAVPLLRQRLGYDPAIGSSVMITAVTDSGGFFIFLGLATLFLL
mgnify:CR=1 FL=1